MKTVYTLMIGLGLVAVLASGSLAQDMSERDYELEIRAHIVAPCLKRVFSKELADDTLPHEEREHWSKLLEWGRTGVVDDSQRSLRRIFADPSLEEATDGLIEAF